MSEEEYDENNLLLGDSTTPSPEEYKEMKNLLKEYTERIKMLEDVSTHFANEFKIMKKLIIAHVHEVNNNIEIRLKEMNKIVDSKLEKIEGRLETAFQKLECNSEEISKSVRKSNNSSFQTPRKNNDSLLQMFSPIEKSTGKKFTSSVKKTILIEEAPEEDDYTEEVIERVISSEVFENQQETLQKIFKHCTLRLKDLNKGDIRKTMAKTHFAQFFTEGKISSFLDDKHCNSDVVWFGIMKKFKKFGIIKNQEELSYENFEKAIIVMAQGLKDSSSMSPTQRTEMFLASFIHLFYDLIQMREVYNSTNEELLNQTRDLENSHEFLTNNSECFDILKRNRKQLKQLWSFHSTNKKPRAGLQPTLIGVNIKDLFDICQQYGLKSLITKTDLITIFEQRMDLKKNSLFENRLSYNAFELVLIDISNHIYGGKPFCTTYTTIESRVEKLISKLILAYEEDKSFQAVKIMNAVSYGQGI